MDQESGNILPPQDISRTADPGSAVPPESFGMMGLMLTG
jgi:hypothetical protein